MEIEKEQERVPARFKPQNYARTEEQPEPWPLLSLGHAMSRDEQGFYPMSDFRMKGLTKAVPALQVGVGRRGVGTRGVKRRSVGGRVWGGEAWKRG